MLWNFGGIIIFLLNYGGLELLKYYFFLIFCLIEVLLVLSIYIGNNIVNESKKLDLM